MPSIKCVVIGDRAIGKTSLITSTIKNAFNKEYVPTIFDTFTTDVSTMKDSYKINIWDTSGQEEYDSLRPLSYPKTDIYIICFSRSDPSSFHNITNKWLPELYTISSLHESHFYIKTNRLPVFIVSTKSDLVCNSSDEHAVDKVSQEQVEDLIKTHNLLSYMECSAATGHRTIGIFQKIINTYNEYLTKYNSNSDDSDATSIKTMIRNGIKTTSPKHLRSEPVSKTDPIPDISIEGNLKSMNLSQIQRVQSSYSIKKKYSKESKKMKVITSNCLIM